MTDFSQNHRRKRIGLLNELINYKDVYRTAPATPGLLITGRDKGWPLMIANWQIKYQVMIGFIVPLLRVVNKITY